MVFDLVFYIVVRTGVILQLTSTGKDECEEFVQPGLEGSDHL